MTSFLLTGCPAYGPEDCIANRDVCGPNASCDFRTGMCVRIRRETSGRTCSEPADCRSGQTCSSSGECQAGSCALHGCIDGYRCVLGDGGHICVSED